MLVLDGKLAAAAVKEVLKAETAELVKKGMPAPHLAAILVGNNGASETYVASKVKNCEETGFESTLIRLPVDTTESVLLETIQSLNNNPSIDGILVQLPLPKHISEEKVIETIDPRKDVDGFHPSNIGRLVQGLPTFIPATPYGILLLLAHYNISTKGKHAVVIGRSNIVGKPVANILLQKKKGANATVTVCHTRTKNMAEHTKRADILIVAAGFPKAVTADMVKDGVVVIDVGVNEVGKTPEGKRILAGDVDFEPIKEKASYITPVPGGVGPMTIVMLMLNTVRAAKIANNLV